MLKMKHKKRTTKKISKNSSLPQYTIHYGKKTIYFIADKVIIFRLMQKIGNRLWGVWGLAFMTAGLLVCFAIRPDMRQWSTAFSDFGNDVRTAPYLAASLFFGAYGLWRWRNYLRKTLSRARPITTLVSLTVIGLYTAALMPIAFESWPYKVHIAGVTLAGVSMAATVVVDTLLTKHSRGNSLFWWKSLRFTSFLLIVVGGFITFGSISDLRWFELALLGELMMLTGYGFWIFDKTYKGEGSRTQLSRLLHKIVLVD
jgi:hypothetical protein